MVQDDNTQYRYRRYGSGSAPNTGGLQEEYMLVTESHMGATGGRKRRPEPQQIVMAQGRQRGGEDVIEYVEDDIAYDDQRPTRMPSSVLRHRPIYDELQADELSTRRPAMQVQHIYHQGPLPLSQQVGYPQPVSHQQRIPRQPGPYAVYPQHAPSAGAVRKGVAGKQKDVHWLLILGVGMLLMWALWLVLMQLNTMWQSYQQDVAYGRPRLFETTAVVGQNDSDGSPSYFFAVNVNGRIGLIELPGGDYTKSRIYMGPSLFGDGKELTPVTLEFKDVNGDGKKDMVIHMGTEILVMINTGTGFRPQNPGEKIHL
jgi:hypothetical protein